MSQCTYRCVVLPDLMSARRQMRSRCLNAPTGAWCSLTARARAARAQARASQCTYRCVVLPDSLTVTAFRGPRACLNAPTGAWCSLTPASESGGMTPLRGPGAPPAPGAPLQTGQHQAQTST